MKINLHSHTQFCDGRATMEEMVRAARAAGFKTWGFTPHSPISIPSPCNMREGDVPLYLNEVKRLRKLFPDMEILAGMEVDYLDENEGPASEKVRSYGLDFVIGSVHFIPNQRGEFFDIDGSPERFAQRLRDNFDGDLDYVVETFWSQTCKMLDAGGLDIVGHIDKIAHNASTIRPGVEEEREYKRMAREAIEKAIRHGYDIEINTKQWERYERFFPNPRYWTEIDKRGIRMPINSDAHYTDKVDSGMEKAFELFKKLKNEHKTH